MQTRLRKYSRDISTHNAVASRQITETSLAIIAAIHDFKIIPTSLLVRLVEGHEKNIQRHLQQLYHKGLINRFAFMRGRNPAEFQQGPVLWNKVEVPKIAYKDRKWQESDETEYIPHRPDAFFTLNYPHEPTRPAEHFFYEADRHRTNANKYNKKLRGHFHFVV